MSPVLQLCDVGISYERPAGPPLVVASGVDLTVETGEVVCLAGRSGSGKTSLLRVAAGLQRPTAGAVFWSGEDISTFSATELADRRRVVVAYVDQQASMVDHLRADDNALLTRVPRRLTKTDRADAVAVLDSLGLGDRVTARADSLSGGERQRLALARGILADALAMLIDEPTASLDHAAALTVVQRLRSLATAGAAIVVASHDQLVIDEADQVLHFD
jgi:ABC-type lipoprotein export system ATPase subunit